MIYNNKLGFMLLPNEASFKANEPLDLWGGGGDT